jgi:HEAT repeat protein
MYASRRLNPLLLVLAVLTGCSQTPVQPAAIVTWLDCVECTAAQLDAVKALGDRAVPEFRALLLRGPSDTRLEIERQRLRTAYQALKDYERRHPQNAVQGTEQQYIDRYLPQFVLRYRLRAARALGAIATPSARAALQDAQKLPNLSEVLRTEIAKALTPASSR